MVTNFFRFNFLLNKKFFLVTIFIGLLQTFFFTEAWGQGIFLRIACALDQSNDPQCQQVNAPPEDDSGGDTKDLGPRPSLAVQVPVGKIKYYPLYSPEKNQCCFVRINQGHVSTACAMPPELSTSTINHSMFPQCPDPDILYGNKQHYVNHAQDYLKVLGDGFSSTSSYCGGEIVVDTQYYENFQCTEVQSMIWGTYQKASFQSSEVGNSSLKKKYASDRIYGSVHCYSEGVRSGGPNKNLVDAQHLACKFPKFITNTQGQRVGSSSSSMSGKTFEGERLPGKLEDKDLGTHASPLPATQAN